MTQTWKTLINCDNHSTAHIIKSVLESEEIIVNITDENMAMFKNGIVTIGIQVANTDYERASNLLVENGYLEDEKSMNEEQLKKIDKLTNQIPIINQLRVELRVLILLAIMLFIVISTSVLISYNL